MPSLKAAVTAAVWAAIPPLPPVTQTPPFMLISRAGYADPGDSVSHLMSGQQAPFLPKRPGGSCCRNQDA